MCHLFIRSSNAGFLTLPRPFSPGGWKTREKIIGHLSELGGQGHITFGECMTMFCIILWLVCLSCIVHFEN